MHPIVRTLTFASGTIIAVIGEALILLQVALGIGSLWLAATGMLLGLAAICLAIAQGDACHQP
jgi:hypothetical protein